MGSEDAAKYLLLTRCPYLKEYSDIRVYSNLKVNDWIYIGFPKEPNEGGTKKHVLYTPISALIARDAQAIVDCHLGYWKQYGGGEYYAREKAFIERTDVQAFLKKVAE